MSHVPHGYARVKMRLDWPGATPGVMPWPKYRAFMDAFVGAVGSLRDGPTAEDILPFAVGEGSVIPEALIHEQFIPTIRRLVRGPGRDWSKEERDGVQPLYDLALALQLSLFQIKAGNGRFVSVHCPAESRPGPRARPPETYRQRESIVGRVVGVSGQTFGATLDTPAGRVQCAADFNVTCDFGKYLFCLVEVDGTATRRLDDDRVEEFAAESVTCLDDRRRRPGTRGPSQRDVVNQIRELLADDWAGKSTAEVLGEET
jgi:hypothetical protein